MIKEKDLHYDNAQSLKKKYVAKLEALTSQHYSEASSEVIYLEMMSYVSDLMNQYLNQIDQRHYYKYAKLLQIQTREAQNEQLLVQFHTNSSIFASKELIDQNKCYHLKNDMDMLPAVANMYHIDGENNRMINIFLNHEEGAYPFQNKDFKLNIVFCNLLEVHKQYCLYFDIKEVKERNQTRNRRYHFSQWNLQYQGYEQRHCVKIMEDTTYDFLFSGCIYFTLEEKMKSPVLTLVFSEMHYDQPLIIKRILINTNLLEQKKVYAKMYELSQRNPLPQGINWLQSLVLSNIKTDAYVAVKHDGLSKQQEDEYLLVYQNKDIERLQIKKLKGIVRERIQLPLTMHIASIQLAFHHQNVYQVLEVCDYWEEHPTKPYGCYFDRQENTLTFGNGRDYLLPPKGSTLVFLDLTVYNEETPIQKDDMEQYGTVLNTIRPFVDREDIQSLRARISNVFSQKNNCMDKEDVIRKAKALPMSCFLFLDYNEQERNLMYHCGTKMEEAFDRYLSDYINTFSLVNREIRVTQIQFIDSKVSICTDDITLREKDLKDELNGWMNDKRYGSAMVIKKKLQVMYAITNIHFYVNEQEIYRFEWHKNKRYRISELRIEVSI